ncbi:MAG TPA: DoxX family protein [Candidatus Nanoarchaeia archaeon]|nr:DoxX family protein [Candidatus Nanoarchaeia archaeon]
MEILGRYSDKYGSVFYLLFRLIIGALFFMHGGMKLFGWFLPTAGNFPGFVIFIGVLELLIGLAVFFGVLTRLAALGGVIIMLGAYFTAHLGNPLTSGGEPAVLFLCTFLILMIYGARKLSLEKALFKKEFF